MDTESYCKNLENLEKTQAIRAIHQAYLQLNAIENSKGDEVFYDNSPVLFELKECLKIAGHVGFVD